MKRERTDRLLEKVLIAGFTVWCGCAAPQSTTKPSAPEAAAPTSPTVVKPFEEPTGVLNLRQALKLARDRHPDLAVVRAEIRIREADVLQAGLRPNPEAGVEVEDVLGTGDFSGVNEAQTTLQISQLIELGGKRDARVRAAQRSRDLATRDLQQVQVAVYAGTAEAFIKVLSLQERMTLAEEGVAQARGAYDAVKRQVEVARTRATEEVKAGVALASVTIERDQARRALDAARFQLAAQWASREPRFESVQGDLEVLPKVPALADLEQRLQSNPELERWAAEALDREARLALEHAKRIPDITVNGGYRRISGPDENAFVAGISVPLPLFNKNQGSIRAAEHRLSQAEDQRRSTELRLRTALRQAWEQLTAAEARVTAMRTTVLPGAQQLVEQTSQQYANAGLSYLEVLDAQRTLFAERAKYLEALNEFHLAVLAIERLIGASLTEPPNQP